MEKFDEATQKELATFLEREQAMAKMQSSIHQLTGVCWKKCVTGTPGKYFSRSEESCLANCVDRFLDSSLFLVKQIEQKRLEGGV
ncbi:Tim10/DDP family zinc finger-domain-containing protein [Flammula alnicola]|nr:Tim10/DDP family zinc finger-domain-containing protein [Flammula alnicola]